MNSAVATGRKIALIHLVKRPTQVRINRQQSEGGRESTMLIYTFSKLSSRGKKLPRGAWCVSIPKNVVSNFFTSELTSGNTKGSATNFREKLT